MTPSDEPRETDMAGHSKFKNIQHRKGAQDKKRAKIFGRLIKELTVAARAGTDPASNPRLRTALAAARGANMPKDNIERMLEDQSIEGRGSANERGLGRASMGVSCFTPYWHGT